jgi:hypothetical protein
MEPDVMKFAQMAGIFVATCGSIAVIMFLFFSGIRLLKRMSPKLSAPKADDQRLMRLEQAVDTIAVEVERISESQRFISRLLGERNKESAKLPQ